MTYRLTRTAAIAATTVVAGLGLSACGGGSSAGANSAAITPATSSSSSATSSAPHAAKATHVVRATAKKVSRDQVRPTVTTRTVTTAETVSFVSVRKFDSTLADGRTRVERSGVPGTATATWRQQLTGKVVARTTLVKRHVTKQPVSRVVVIGTKKAAPAPAPKSVSNPSTKPANTGGLDLSRAAMWDRIAQCESTGNWHINSGNGYYGGLQFDSGTWLGAGGGKFAARADLATRAQQITIANHVYDSRGLSPWQCGWAA